MFNEVEYQVTEINQIENNTLGDYNPTAKEISSGIEDFNQFGFYNQIRSIAITFNIAPEIVEQMPWNKCFIELAYNNVLSKYLKKMGEV